MSLFKRKTFKEKRIAQLEKLILSALKKADREAKRGYVSLALGQLALVGRLEEELELFQRDED